MKHTKLLTLAIAALFAGSAMAETELFSTDFSSADWTDHASICAGATKSETINGIYFYCDNSEKSYSIADGVLTFANNNISNRYYIAIALQNVNSVIDVTIGTASNGQRVSYAFVEADATSVPSYPSSTTSTATSDNTNSEINLSYTMKGTGTSAWIFIGRQGSGYASVIKTIKVTTLAKDIATLSSISIDGKPIADFASETTTYNVELPFGTTAVPTVTATATSEKANAVVTNASALPGATTIDVTAQDGTTKKTYTVNFTVAATASSEKELLNV